MLPRPGGPFEWSAPLPDLSRTAIRQVVRIGGQKFGIAVSPVQRDVPGEPDTHLVHLRVTVAGQALTPLDVGIRTPDACATAWAYLTNRLNETVVQFYSPRPRNDGELNPRLGCWGPRPDLLAQGLGESDCAIAVVLGLSIWTPGSLPPVDDVLFLEALRDTLVEAVSYWVLLARRSALPRERLN